MKINLTLYVSDDLRRLMGASPECKTTQAGLAQREEVIHFLQAKLCLWETIAAGFSEPEVVTEGETDAYRDAITYLKSLQWTDTQIKRWIFRQRARRDVINGIMD